MENILKDDIMVRMIQLRGLISYRQHRSQRRSEPEKEIRFEIEL